MAFDFFRIPEHTDSTANPPTYTERWKATGTTSQAYVQSFAVSATAGVVATGYGILYRQDIRVSQSAYNQFDVEIPYAARKKEVGTWTWDYDTTGATIHITTSKETIASYPVGTAPDHKQSIGVNGDNVEGTDKVLPALKINVTYKHPSGVITLPQVKVIASITGSVNSTPMLTFAPGELLFLGSRGSDGTEAEATATYMFAASSNVTGLTIGDITGVAKKGWETAWIRFKDDVDGGEPTRVPQYVYVERIYDDFDLASILGFGS
jgi:hypothetical protein